MTPSPLRRPRGRSLTGFAIRSVLFEPLFAALPSHPALQAPHAHSILCRLWLLHCVSDANGFRALRPDCPRRSQGPSEPAGATFGGGSGSSERVMQRSDRPQLGDGTPKSLTYSPIIVACNSRLRGSVLNSPKKMPCQRPIDSS